MPAPARMLPWRAVLSRERRRARIRYIEEEAVRDAVEEARDLVSERRPVIDPWAVALATGVTWKP